MSDLLDRYPLTAGTYHELLDDSGAVRAHWRRLLDHLQRSTPAQLAQRQALLTRQIQENGVTYNVYADPKGADRPWELDLLPHVLAADEWQQLSAGIAQRARLLNAVLADLYGPQRLIKEGLLPAELVFGHNNFLWPCQGIQPPDEMRGKRSPSAVTSTMSALSAGARARKAGGASLGGSFSASTLRGDSTSRLAAVCTDGSAASGAPLPKPKASRAETATRPRTSE